jgi:hypothetical protein
MVMVESFRGVNRDHANGIPLGNFILACGIVTGYKGPSKQPRPEGSADMTSHLGRTFTHHGLKGATQVATVVAQSEPKGARAKVLLTVRLEDGTEFKMAPSQIPAEIVFAPAATGPMFTRGDQYRYDRNGRIFCK